MGLTEASTASASVLLEHAAVGCRPGDTQSISLRVQDSEHGCVLPWGRAASASELSVASGLPQTLYANASCLKGTRGAK